MITMVKDRLELIRPESEGSVGAEIGVRYGEFSAQILSLPLKQLWLVDAWRRIPGVYDTISDEAHTEYMVSVLRKFAGDIHTGRVCVRQGLSLEVAKSGAIPPLDWFYLDADHHYQAVMDDLIAWSALLKPKGVIFGHDYAGNENARAWEIEVVPAVDDFCEKYGWRLTNLTNELMPSYRLERA